MVYAYLSFNGNCREAMTFYRHCLGGELQIQTIGDGPGTNLLPRRMKEYVMQATLKSDNILMMGTDLLDETGLIKGNTISLMLFCRHEKEIKQFYRKLSSDGIPTYPVKKTNDGTLFGTLTDKFGTHWLLHSPNKKEHQKSRLPGKY